jgi:hypothetical protein
MESKDDKSWQWRVLPIIEGILLSLATLFIAFSCAQLFILQKDIQNSPQLELTAINANIKLLQQTNPSEAAKLNTALTLETFILQQHYHQANALLMARTWVRYLGFTTGMILALIGASFILGKLQTARSEFEAKTETMALTFRSTSPGLLLATLGTILMLATVVTNHTITTTYQPLYLGKYLISTDQVMTPDSFKIHDLPNSLTLPELPNLNTAKSNN